MPTAVTTARKTLSDRRGSVVISRGGGGANGAVVTRAYLSGAVDFSDIDGERKVNDQ